MISHRTLEFKINVLYDAMDRKLYTIYLSAAVSIDDGLINDVWNLNC